MVNPQLLKATFACCLLFISSYTIAQIVERKENIKDFDQINVSSDIDLYLKQSANEEIVLKGDKELIADINVQKDNNGVLNISLSPKARIDWKNKESVKAYVSFKTLKAINASGGCDVYTKGTVKLASLSIQASGDSDVSATLEVKNLKINASGGSDVKLNGKAETLTVSATGGSDIEAFGLKTNQVDAKLSGGSDGEFFATKSISINASGASDVEYKGTAALNIISNTGGSDVKKVK